MVRSDVLAAPFFAACFVLLASGISKLRRTGPTQRALYAAGLPSHAAIVVALGSIELVIAIAGIVTPIALVAGTIALTYAAFGGFLAYLLVRRVPAASCGCAGTKDLPPSWLHVTLDAVAALVAACVATAGSATGLWTFAREQPAAGIPFVLGTVLIAWLASVTVTYAPALFNSYEGKVRA